jgi:succinate dehydrogenase flavin-adding protein (antitoxin of CptAB toxin-antitoxin module)
MNTNLEKVKKLAKDLRADYPRSPREKLGGYVIAARCVDKCRAFLLGMHGEYSYWPCSLASQWFAFTGITPEQLKDVVATGATDDDIARWITEHSKVKDPEEVLKWNNRLRDMRLSDMNLQAQQYLEEYIPKFVPSHRPVYVWFDVYDLEEKRL